MHTTVKTLLDTPVSRLDCLSKTELAELAGFGDGMMRSIVDETGRPAPIGAFGWLVNHDPDAGPRYAPGVLARWLPDGSMELAADALPSRDVARSEPADAVETRLIEVWQRVLGVDGIAPESNFFDLGGYSLRVVELFRAINREFGTQIPFTQLFQSPTLRALASVIRDRTLQQYSCLVPVQTRGQHTPLFIVQSYLLYEALPRAFGNQQPLYGLLEPPVDQRTPPYRLEEIATLYAAAIRRAQPEGPYLLLAWCAAGIVALEVARQIEMSGARVGLLGLIDAWCPVRPADATAPASGVQIPERDQESTLRLAAAVKRFAERLRTRAWRNAAAWWLDRAKPLPGWLSNASELTIESIRRFRPQPVTCPIVVFRAEVGDFRPYEDPWCGWRPWTRNQVVLVPVPGNHLSMFHEPQLSITARRILSALEPEGAGVNPLPPVLAREANSSGH